MERGIEEMDRAVTLAPDNRGVLIPRRRPVRGDARMPADIGRLLLEKAVRDYEHVLAIQASSSTRSAIIRRANCSSGSRKARAVWASWTRPECISTASSGTPRPQGRRRRRTRRSRPAPSPRAGPGLRRMPQMKNTDVGYWLRIWLGHPRVGRRRLGLQRRDVSTPLRQLVRRSSLILVHGLHRPAVGTGDALAGPRSVPVRVSFQLRSRRRWS